MVFLPALVGYLGSAALNEDLHLHLGRRGIAIIGPVCHLVTFVVAALHPPYPVLLVAIAFSGFGNGILDAAWNAWISEMPRANEFMGVLHSLYGVGATVSPLVATAMITKGHTEWFALYYVLVSAVQDNFERTLTTQIGLGALELLVSAFAFWDSRPLTATSQTGRKVADSALWASLTEPTTWVMSLVGFFYMGAEVTIGGWLPTFLLSSRGVSEFAAGMALVGFWLGVIFGTLTLAFAVARVGERPAVSSFLAVTLAMQLIVWLVPNFFAATIASALTGFWIGPVFPTAIVVAAKLLPEKLHVTSIGIISTLGCTGSTVFPFIFGVLAQHAGVKYLPTFVFGVICVLAGLWLLPLKKKPEEQVIEKERRASVFYP